MRVFFINGACNDDDKEVPAFHGDDVEPSSTCVAMPTPSGISVALQSRVEFAWTLVMSDSAGPVDRLNSRSTSGCDSFAFRLEPAYFFGLGVFSLPRCRVKSNSRSIEDSSSFSFAEDIVVQAVAELPLLSEELDERPSTRDKEEPTCWPLVPSMKLHFRLIPFDAIKSGTKEQGESSRKIVSMQ